MLKLIDNLKIGKFQKIVTYGTSLTAKGAWVELLDLELKKRYPGLCEVINSGKSAMHSQWAVENLSEKVLKYKPDVLFIEFAVNDAFSEYAINLHVSYLNIKYIIERVAVDLPDCEFILMIMNPPAGIHLEQRPDYKEYYQMYRDIAGELALSLIDNQHSWDCVLSENKALAEQLIPDGIHPSREGDIKVTFKNIVDTLDF